ncbi:N-acetylglucosamine-6-phosphate deacetylase [Paenibacillus spongiae]|uniref:N-acetylglucosamine-6-phosphate deacetylase n=1 Tax=Paenibacillus spongiae TaxID=2909671 RepID=A0ABY5SD83_9BACL|nr:N-acetylglucosamine-6-phosphate deacetylase [Paenibacillus spongiae]UVI31907.1 N-acetylglucosamine-6-phosphate deacetylase [Paenibacillus spongiae]
MADARSLRIGNVRIVAEDQWFWGEVDVKNGLIADIRSTESNADQTGKQAAADSGVPYVDGKEGWLLPGFIDIHVHGGYGSDFMDASSDAFDVITKYHAANGTTAMLATTVTASHDAIQAVLEATDAYRKRDMPYAELIGVHLEGPFISEKWPGAQNPAFITPPQTDWLKPWAAQWPSLIKMMTLAPERDGALNVIEWLSANGIVPALGHTDASYDDVVTAVQHGLRHAVHTYNAMTGLHHRKPGTLGAVMTEDAISAEIIADGHHAHPAAVKLLSRTKPSDKLVLITDAMSAAGLGDGQYGLGGLEVSVKDGVARLVEGGSLAGSTLTMIEAFRFMLKHTDLSVTEVSRCASGNPAKVLGMENQIGSIAVGKQADLVLTDDTHHIVTTWVKGRSVSQ